MPLLHLRDCGQDDFFGVGFDCSLVRREARTVAGSQGADTKDCPSFLEDSEVVLIVVTGEDVDFRFWLECLNELGQVRSDFFGFLVHVVKVHHLDWGDFGIVEDLWFLGLFGLTSLRLGLLFVFCHNLFPAFLGYTIYRCLSIYTLPF